MKQPTIPKDFYLTPVEFLNLYHRFMHDASITYLSGLLQLHGEIYSLWIKIFFTREK